MTAYLLVASDGWTKDGPARAASRIATERLRRGLWPLYTHTQYVKLLQPDDECFIYLAGKSEGAQRIIGRALIAGVNEVTGDWFESSTLIGRAPRKVISLKSQVLSDQPADFRILTESLNLTQYQRENWGQYMQGGCRMLIPEDAELIRTALDPR